MRTPHAGRSRRLAGAVAAGLLSVVASGAPAQAGVQVAGAGSTFAQIALDQWRADAARSLGIEVNYSGLGSTAGRNQFSAGSVDFASSDIGFEPNENSTRPFTYLPIVAGGTALMYNLKDRAQRPITDLRLSGRTVARIFTGEIQNWGHPEILADNPHLADRIPAGNSLKPVVRSGGSGTTAVFTAYMAKVAPDVWASFAQKYGIRGSFTSSYPDVPTATKQSGSDGIANFVATPGSGADSIGYAEAGYALQRGLPMVYVRNEASNWTQPTARNVAVALTQAVRNSDGTQNLDRVYFHTHPEAYPISSYNYLIAPTTGFDPAKGEVLGKYIIYSVTEGQSKAARLGYSPLPPNLVQQALDAVREIPGAPAPPPLGEWGKYYEQLEVARAPDPTPSGPGVQTGTAAAGGTTTTTSAGADGPKAGATVAAAPAAGTAAGSSPGASLAAGSASTASARAAGAGRAGAARTGPAGPAATAPGASGAVAELAGPGAVGGTAAPAAVEEEVAIGDGRPVRSIKGRSALPMFLVALLLLAVVFVPALAGGFGPGRRLGTSAQRAGARWPPWQKAG